MGHRGGIRSAYAATMPRLFPRPLQGRGPGGGVIHATTLSVTCMMRTNNTTVQQTDVSHVIAILLPHLPALKQHYHIKSLGLFGSYVRNEQTPDSDLDVLVEFDELPGLLTYVELQQTLSDLLHISVDLVHRPDLKPHIGEHVLAEVIML